MTILVGDQDYVFYMYLYKIEVEWFERLENTPIAIIKAPGVDPVRTGHTEAAFRAGLRQMIENCIMRTV